MICRRPTAPAVASAAALVLAFWGAPVRAASLSASPASPYEYVLTTTQDIPASTGTGSGPLVVFEAPPGSIVPPVDPKTGNQQSPVTPVTTPYLAADGKTYTTDPMYTTSKDVFVFTRPTVSAGGQPVDELGFAFRNGLSHNSAFVFSLAVADPKNPPALHSLSPGVPDYPFPPPAAPAAPATITAAAVAPTAPASVTVAPVATTAVSQLNTPEPVSLALWSALTVAGACRARAYRRSRAS